MIIQFLRYIRLYRKIGHYAKSGKIDEADLELKKLGPMADISDWMVLSAILDLKHMEIPIER